jgi:tetratricopeptide (TPR) repeat protein
MNLRLRVSPFIWLGFVLVFSSCPCLAEHRDTWTQIQSPHFTVLSNAGEREGRRVAVQFEEIRALFLHLYPTLRVDAGKPTIVFAIKNEDSLKLFIPSYGQNSKAMHLGGFYHPSYNENFAVIRTDVRGGDRLANRTLYHEYTHAFFRNNFRGLPLWLDEGLAEFYGNTSIESSESGVGMPNESEIRTLKQNRPLPIDQLLTIDRTSPLYNTSEHSGIFYAESWVLVHYLTLSPEMRGQGLIDKYLQALHATDDPMEAANQTFGDLSRMSDKLDNYISRFTFPYERVPLQSKLSEKDFTVRDLSAAEGVLAQANFLLRSNHLPEGLEKLHEVEKLDPTVRGYHSELGHYHFLKADYDNAERELQVAIAADPNDWPAHIDMALLYLRRDNYTTDSTPKIRSELEKVLSLSPDFAPAHAFLSIAYAHDPGKDTDKAFAAARRASELEPGNLAYFIDMGKALLAAGRIPEARKVAESAQRVATTTGERITATNFNKQIDYKMKHPQEAASAQPAESDTAAADAAATADSMKNLAQAEGQITELVCGHAPEVILTLTTETSSLLLHASDITKISIQDHAKASDATQLPCSKWRDRRARVSYQAAPSRMTQGEIETISLE